MSINKETGRNIVRLRKERRLTQEWVALEADMSVSYLRSIEHGVANPTIEALSRIAQVLLVEVRDLVTFAPPVAQTETADHSTGTNFNKRRDEYYALFGKGKHR